MKSTAFFKGLSWLFLLNLVVKPVWIFLIDREVQNTVGHEVYGNYFALFNLAYVLGFIADAGLSNLMNRTLAAGQQLNVFRYLKIKLLLSGVYLIAAIAAGWWYGLGQWNVFVFVVAIQVLGSLFIFLRSMITAHQYFTPDAWLSVLDKLLVILACGGFILLPAIFGSISLSLFLTSQLVCTAIAVGVALTIALKKGLFTAGIKEEASPILRSMMPFGLVILLMSLLYRMDAILLKSFHSNGAYEAGIYASAYRLLDACNMAGYLAASFLVPFIARNLIKKEIIKEAIGGILHILMLFGMGVLLFSLLFAPWIQQLLYHSDTAYHSSVIRLCMAVLPAYLLMHIYGSALTATASFRSLILIVLASVILNFVLNLFLIPVHGAFGCCIAALVSHYFCAFTCSVAATRKLQLSYLSLANMQWIAMVAGLGIFLYFARMTMLNVWLIIFLSACLLPFLIPPQFRYSKNFLIRKPLTIPDA